MLNDAKLGEPGLTLHATATEDDDVIAERNRAAMMADDDRRAAAGPRPQRLDDRRFRETIHGVCGLVQNQDIGIAHQSSCQGNALPLPGREVDASIADDRLVSLGQVFDKLVRLGQFCGALASTAVATFCP